MKVLTRHYEVAGTIVKVDGFALSEVGRDLRAKGKIIRIVSLLSLPCLLLSLMQLVTASLESVARANSDLAVNPIFGMGGEDPFPADPQRPDSTVDEGAQSVAFVFGLGYRSGWASMGGETRTLAGRLCPNEEKWPDYYRKQADKRTTADGRSCRNWDTNIAFEEEMKRHRGSSLKVGIYTFARKADESNNRLYHNTPNLKATSLQNKAGYDAVINKIRSLDGSKDGRGSSPDHAWGNNLQYGLAQVYKDMADYESAQRKANPNVAPKPLYTKIIVLTHGDNKYYLQDTVKKNDKGWYEADLNQLDVDGNFVNRPETEANGYFRRNRLDARPGTAGALGVANLIRGKGAELRILGMGDWSEKMSQYGDTLKALAEATTSGKEGRYQHIDFSSKGDNDYWVTPGSYEYSDNQIVNGTLERVLRQWILEEKTISITSDWIDQDFRYVKPNVGQSINMTVAGGRSYALKTNQLGRTFVRLTGQDTAHGVTIQEQGSSGKKLSTMLANVPRCWGVNVKNGKSGELEAEPEALAVDKDGNGGFNISGQQMEDYRSIKCSMYSRPLQQAQIIKKGKVTNEQIRFEVGGYPRGKPVKFVGGARYSFTYSCADPLGQHPNTLIVEGKAQRLLENVNVAVTMAPINMGKLPVGARCAVKEKIVLPSGRPKEELNRLFTSVNKLSSQHLELEDKQNHSDKGQATSASATGVVR